MLSKFIQAYPPSPSVRPITTDEFAPYAGVVSPGVEELWKEHGFGKYGGGLFEVVEPWTYEASIYPWIFRDEKKRYVPLIMTAFGILFYQRQLNNPAMPNFTRDFQRLDPHYANVVHAVFEDDEFFNAYLLNDEIRVSELNVDKWQQALAAGLAKPALGEIFCYTPALVMGGDGAAATCSLGNAVVHFALLRSMRA